MEEREGQSQGSGGTGLESDRLGGWHRRPWVWPRDWVYSGEPGEGGRLGKDSELSGDLWAREIFGCKILQASGFLEHGEGTTCAKPSGCEKC